MRKSVYAICDQQRHRFSLPISVFIVCCLESIISVSISEISSLYLASVAAQTGFESMLVANPEDRLSHDEARISLTERKHLLVLTLT